MRIHTHSERGIALVLALFLTTVMSVLAASMMFLAQTETYASMNYRMMSQARYAAEAGVQRAGNFLIDTAQYAKPGTVAGDPLTAYEYDPTIGCPHGCSPVKRVSNGLPVVLSAIPGVASNYPVAAVATAFNNASHGALTAGTTTLNYGAKATLMSMQTFDPYGGTAGGTPGVVQTWEITSQGSLGGAHTATVEVVAYVEQPVWPANAYGAFATGNTCGAMYFHGNVTINSYDSGGLSGNTAPTTSASGGNVGTNGNLDIEGSVAVQGNLYSPRTGVGVCTAGAVDALSENGSATVTGSMVRLPGNVTYPTPPAPSPMPPTNSVTINGLAGACAAMGFTGATAGWCSTSGSGAGAKITIDSGGAPIQLPSLSLGTRLEITAHAAPAQVVNINSFDLSSGGNIAVKATATNQSVLLNIAGKNPDGTNMDIPVEFGGNSGGTFENTSACAGCSYYDASMLQMIYGGPGTINMRGNSQASATVYAPNAAVNFNGTADLYGSILGRTVTNGGNASIHFDRRLLRDFYVEGAQMLGTFTWKRN